MERLWASSGQRALESSRILVIGSSATSAGILKNLVLPGKRCPFTLYGQVAIHDARPMFKMMVLAKDLDFASWIVFRSGLAPANFLPSPSGIGHYTVLDSQDVAPEDAGNNFFLHYNSIGKPRAKEIVRFLNEMNESVDGEADISVRCDPRILEAL